ncbi:MAG: AIPR family protein [Sediminibacterium sp.]
MSKYSILVNIIDVIRKEASTQYVQRYIPDELDTERINKARSRAFIHLFLKVSFGILDFDAREYYLTDGNDDGGIDGYFIDKVSKSIYFIQSKFRISEKNFETKKIELEEILAMDINRILDGEEMSESGVKYHGKIFQLIRDIKKIDDIARYRYQVIILANLANLPQSKLRLLTGGYATEVFDFDKSYEKLVFPVISGTYFNAADLNINIDLSNKNAGSKISYKVQTRTSECEITVLFVPTIELAKILYKYKNSILKYNPRSYLDLEGQKVNNAIRQTILHTQTNEFALFNNGITMLSDETFINEKIGDKRRAQLIVKNPQIINGGQTSFTLSRIFEEYATSNYEQIFENKEVLLKIITLTDDGDIDPKLKLNLIEDISTATNQQTPVNGADKFSNETIHIELQKILFDRYGLLYERKRGEFGDGLYNGYINAEQVVERNLFFRIYYAVDGQINKAIEKKLFLKQDFTSETLSYLDKLDSFYFGYLTFRKIFNQKNPGQRIEKNFYGQIFAMNKLFRDGDVSKYSDLIKSSLGIFKYQWDSFIEKASKVKNSHIKTYVDQTSQSRLNYFNESKWFSSTGFERDVINYFTKDGYIELDNKPIVETLILGGRRTKDPKHLERKILKTGNYLKQLLANKESKEKLLSGDVTEDLKSNYAIELDVINEKIAKTKRTMEKYSKLVSDED